MVVLSLCDRDVGPQNICSIWLFTEYVCLFMHNGIDSVLGAEKAINQIINDALQSRNDDWKS